MQKMIYIGHSYKTRAGHIAKTLGYDSEMHRVLVDYPPTAAEDDSDLPPGTTFEEWVDATTGQEYVEFEGDLDLVEDLGPTEEGNA